MKRPNHWLRACLFGLFVFLSLTGLAGCNAAQEPIPPTEEGTEEVTAPTEPVTEPPEEETEPETEPPYVYIDAEGMTLETRVNPPEGYVRIPADEGSLAEFLRGYALKEDGAQVLLYNGEPKRNQRRHAAVFALPIEAEDLQQCADSVMRVYAEYYWNTGQTEKIAFHLVGGFLMDYPTWRAGNRVRHEGNSFYWVAAAGYDDSYAAFQEYLRIVFAYAGTLSMVGESDPIRLSDIQIGDVFLRGGSPGHVVMVVDICENADGEKAFLLAQGLMPAQEFQLMNNLRHREDPWYYEDEILGEPEHNWSVLQEEYLRRLHY